MKYLNWSVIKEDFKNYNPWSLAVSFYLFVMLNDYISSKLACRIKDVHEQNPFARDANLKFVLHKALVVDSVYLIATAITAYLIYQTLAHWNIWIGKALSAGLFVYMAYDRLFDAVISNYLLGMNLYQEDPHLKALEILKGLFQ